MTKKDYIIIANAFSKAILELQDNANKTMLDDDDTKINDAKISGIALLKHYMIGELWANNTKFNEDKFNEFIKKQIQELKSN